VLWPAFVHCYLGLVKRNATAEAHQLITRHKARFTDAAAGAANQQHTQVRKEACMHVAQPSGQMRCASIGVRPHTLLVRELRGAHIATMQCDKIGTQSQLPLPVAHCKTDSPCVR